MESNTGNEDLMKLADDLNKVTTLKNNQDYANLMDQTPGRILETSPSFNENSPSKK